MDEQSAIVPTPPAHPPTLNLGLEVSSRPSVQLNVGKSAIRVASTASLNIKPKKNVQLRVKPSPPVRLNVSESPKPAIPVQPNKAEPASNLAAKALPLSMFRPDDLIEFWSTDLELECYNGCHAIVLGSAEFDTERDLWILPPIAEHRTRNRQPGTIIPVAVATSFGILVKSPTFCPGDVVVVMQGEHKGQQFVISGYDWENKTYITTTAGVSLSESSLQKIDPIVAVGDQVVVYGYAAIPSFNGRKGVVVGVEKEGRQSIFPNISSIIDAPFIVELDGESVNAVEAKIRWSFHRCYLLKLSSPYTRSSSS